MVMTDVDEVVGTNLEDGDEAFGDDENSEPTPTRFDKLKENYKGASCAIDVSEETAAYDDFASLLGGQKVWFFALSVACAWRSIAVSAHAVGPSSIVQLSQLTQISCASHKKISWHGGTWSTVHECLLARHKGLAKGSPFRKKFTRSFNPRMVKCGLVQYARGSSQSDENTRGLTYRAGVRVRERKKIPETTLYELDAN